MPVIHVHQANSESDEPANWSYASLENDKLANLSMTRGLTMLVIAVILRVSICRGEGKSWEVEDEVND